jgi:hypothetical protein
MTEFEALRDMAIEDGLLQASFVPFEIAAWTSFPTPFPMLWAACFLDLCAGWALLSCFS